MYRSAESAVDDLDGLGRGSVARSDFLESNEIARDELTEDGVLAVEPRARDEGQEELRSVGVRSGVRHGEQAGLGVLDDEVLVLELGAVDGLSSGSVSDGEVSTLGHELGDDSVELGSLEVERLAGLADSLLSGAEGSEVLSADRGLVVVQLEGVLLDSTSTDGDVKENVRAGVGGSHFWFFLLFFFS